MNLSLRRMAFSGFAVWMVILILALYFLYPLRKHIRFGIDLVGGTYITLEVQTEKAVQAALLDGMETLVAKLRDAKKTLPISQDATDNKVILTFSSVADAQAAATLLKNVVPDLVLTTQGSTLTGQFSDKKIKAIKEDAVLRNIEVLRTRLDKMSVAEISIAAQGERHIVIELPDVSDPQQAKSMIGTAAILEFKIAERVGNSKEDILYEYDGQLPAGMEIVQGKEDGHQQVYLVSKRAPVSGKDLKEAHPQFDQERGALDVSFTLTPEGGRKFYDLTSKNYKKLLLAILDNQVITAATIEAKIDTNGRIMRGGAGFPQDEAKELSLLLKSGSFVAPVTFEEERQVGPTLGAQAIRQGIIACLVSLILLLLFSVFFYKVAGLFAFIALLYNLVLILMAMSWLNATLTLPGIAGLVLTVGMAIDASILIYERIKEELRRGVALNKAVQDGFSDAMRVILDANITTFIVGAVLYKFGTGPIQGFAVTIMLGIIATLITGLFFLKSLFNFVLNNFHIQKLRI